jgi:hypothetical protein
MMTALLVPVLAGAASQSQKQDSVVANSAEPEPKSLAEIAKSAKKTSSTHAKKLITNEDLEGQDTLPKLNLDGDDNTDEIVQAIGDFKSTHSKDETEQAVHDWYSRYDSILASSAQQNAHTQRQRSSTDYHDYWNCQDFPNYENCILRRRQDMLDQHDAQLKIGANFAAIGRIQQGFTKVRGGIARYNLQYSWFKIRNANGVGSY